MLLHTDPFVDLAPIGAGPYLHLARLQLLLARSSEGKCPRCKKDVDEAQVRTQRTTVKVMEDLASAKAGNSFILLTKRL